MNSRYNYIMTLVKEVENRIEDDSVLYQFILEELEGADGGSDISHKFAQTSGFKKNEYIGAMSNSNSKVDGEDGPQNYLHNVSFSLLNNEFSQEEVTNIRLAVIEVIMKNYSLGRYGNTDDPLDIVFLKKDADGSARLDFYNEYLSFNFTNVRSQTFSDHYFQINDTKYFSPLLGYLDILWEESQIMETRLDGRYRISEFDSKLDIKTEDNISDVDNNHANMVAQLTITAANKFYDTNETQVVATIYILSTQDIVNFIHMQKNSKVTPLGESFFLIEIDNRSFFISTMNSVILISKNIIGGSQEDAKEAVQDLIDKSIDFLELQGLSELIESRTVDGFSS